MSITAVATIGKEVEEKQAVAQKSLARVMTAIKAASQSTGVDFSYLVNQAAQESGFKTDVKAKTSSATGLYQFTEQTWLRMVKDQGSKYGIGGLASQIDVRADGNLTVKDKAVRQQILSLRKNPEMAAAMAAELAEDNKAYLQANIGGAIGKTELYMAHFLGAAGAANFLSALRDNPQANAASLLPSAAAANRSVFYAANGQPRSVSAIYERFAAKMEGKGIEVPDNIGAQPTLLAQVGATLNQIPDLRLAAPEVALAQASSATYTSPNDLSGGTTAAALFSAMVLAQADKFSAKTGSLKDSKAETLLNQVNQQRHKNNDWVQTA